MTCLNNSATAEITGTGDRSEFKLETVLESYI